MTTRGAAGRQWDYERNPTRWIPWNSARRYPAPYPAQSVSRIQRSAARGAKPDVATRAIVAIVAVIVAFALIALAGLASSHRHASVPAKQAPIYRDDSGYRPSTSYPSYTQPGSPWNGSGTAKSKTGMPWSSQGIPGTQKTTNPASSAWRHTTTRDIDPSRTPGMNRQSRWTNGPGGMRYNPPNPTPRVPSTPSYTPPRSYTPPSSSGSRPSYSPPSYSPPSTGPRW